MYTKYFADDTFFVRDKDADKLRFGGSAETVALRNRYQKADSMVVVDEHEVIYEVQSGAEIIQLQLPKPKDRVLRTKIAPMAYYPYHMFDRWE